MDTSTLKQVEKTLCYLVGCTYDQDYTDQLSANQKKTIIKKIFPLLKRLKDEHNYYDTTKTDLNEKLINSRS